jgi:hypothetical protein
MIATLATLAFTAITSLSVQSDCTRVPLPRVPNGTAPLAVQDSELAALLGAAYPALQFVVAERDAYVVERGQAFKVLLHHDEERDKGLLVAAFSYESQIGAALASAKGMQGAGCRAPMEMVIARMRGGAPTIVARGQFDREAVAIDVRDFRIDESPDGISVYAFNRGYYGGNAWFGNVMWRATYWVEPTRLLTQRLPASYGKRSTPGPQEMEGYLAPAGVSGNEVRLEYSSFGTLGERGGVIEFPFGANDWLSGVEILKRVP